MGPWVWGGGDSWGVLVWVGLGRVGGSPMGGGLGVPDLGSLMSAYFTVSWESPT